MFHVGVLVVLDGVSQGGVWLAQVGGSVNLGHPVDHLYVDLAQPGGDFDFLTFGGDDVEVTRTVAGNGDAGDGGLSFHGCLV